MTFNFVYSTPCEGKVTGIMRLGTGGYPEMCPHHNLGRKDGGLHPDLPTKKWLTLESLGRFETTEEMFDSVNRREGWSLIKE